MENTPEVSVENPEVISEPINSVNEEEFNFNEKMEEVRKIKAEPDYRFSKKHGAIKMYLVKFKLKRYIKKSEKYNNLYLKYNKLHSALSLAVVAGFSDIKSHQNHLKYVSEKAINIKNNKYSKDKNGKN